MRVKDTQHPYPISSISIDNNAEYANNKVGAVSANNINDDFRGTINKIEEQLAISRKMFPS